MALRLRMSRGGAKKRPFFRIVVADSRSPRDGRYIERVGTYNPMLPQDHPERIVIKTDRVKHWIEMGATPSERVAKFLGKAEIIPMPAIRETPNKSRPKAKAQERMKAAEEAAKTAAEAPAAEKPAAEEPAVEAPAAVEPAAQETVAVEPAAEAPAAEAPAVEEAAAIEPAAAEEPAAEEPAAEGEAKE